MKLLIPFNYENPELSKTHETSQNELEPAERTQNQPKRTPKTNRETIRNDPKFENWENLVFSTSFCFSNFEPKYPNFGILGQKVLTF